MTENLLVPLYGLRLGDRGKSSIKDSSQSKRALQHSNQSAHKQLKRWRLTPEMGYLEDEKAVSLYPKIDTDRQNFSSAMIIALHGLEVQ